MLVRTRGGGAVAIELIRRRPAKGVGARATTSKVQTLQPVTSHPSEFVDRASDTASVTEHRERPLKVFAIDPSRGVGPRNVVTIRIPYEPLEPGPVGRQIAVVDEELGPDLEFGGPLGTRPGYEKVKLDDPNVLVAGGLEPSEMDLQSHQQMVYAVAMRTIGAFERALGRPVVWPWAVGDEDRLEDRLWLYPHASEMPTAFYAKREGGGALLFGYLRRASGSEENPSSEIVYTALSYDVIAHEMVHPIVEAMAPRARANADESRSFQEGFADLIATLQHFDFHDLVVDTVVRTGGRIHDPELAPDLETGAENRSVQAEFPERNPLFEIGGQFGEAAGLGGAVRLGIMAKPDPAALARDTEPHAQGQILLAAVLDAFVTIYARRTADLRRIGGVSRSSPTVSPDLALRMAAEATKTAGHFQKICIRALDAWPTDDFRLGDYLRALITSDRAAVAVDELGYRSALIAGFRARGIVPDGVTSLTEDGLAWPDGGTRRVRRRRRARGLRRLGACPTSTGRGGSPIAGTSRPTPSIRAAATRRPTA